jgi:hypothetical protein
MSKTDDSLRVILDDVLDETMNIRKKTIDNLVDEENEETREITSKSAIILLRRLKLRITAKLEASKLIEKEFEATVLKTWKKPIDLSDLLLYISLEVASEFSFKRGSKKGSRQKYVNEALSKQQTKACLIFNEILHLLRSGFPSGAYSRWRILHEKTCVSYFIAKHGEEMAKRFLDYEAVENYFQAQAIRKNQQKMDFQSISERDFEKAKEKIRKMNKTYGSDFVKKTNYPYGWVPREVLKTRSLREIEKAGKLDMLRPYYDLAGYVMHGSKGLMFKLGPMAKKSKNAVLPMGPTNYGLADPGKIAAISLGQVTACLLASTATLKRLVIIETLRGLVDEICDAFDEINAEFSENQKK